MVDARDSGWLTCVSAFDDGRGCIDRVIDTSVEDDPSWTT